MFKNKQLLLAIGVLGIAVALTAHAPAFAATNKTTSKSSSTTAKTDSVDISSQVATTYNADNSVQQGMIVQLKDKDPNSVVALTENSTSKILGIIIPNKNVAIVLTSQSGSSQQVLVAANGKHEVLVSNQNGPIKVGDFLSISAIAGVAMKAGVSQDQVIGKAAGTFTGTANVISKVSVKDQLGHTTELAIGRITVDVGITHNPLNQKTVDFLPAFLVGFANTVANKSVSVARIYLASVIVLITTILTIVMLYSGIRSGMIAVGRNPLSKKSIIKSLIQTVFAGLIVYITGILAVYLLLKL